MLVRERGGVPSLGATVHGFRVGGRQHTHQVIRTRCHHTPVFCCGERLVIRPSSPRRGPVSSVVISIAPTHLRGVARRGIVPGWLARHAYSSSRGAHQSVPEPIQGSGRAV